MKKERGFTLIELLAVIVLLAIISAFLFSIIISGINNFDRTSTKQRLQQEGNYITEVIRKEYLKSKTTNDIELVVDILNKELLMDGNVISTGFTYEVNNTSDNPVKIARTGHFHLLLNITDEGHSYEIDTTLSKLE